MSETDNSGSHREKTMKLDIAELNSISSQENDSQSSLTTNILPTPPTTIFVFDYDHTIVDENSDTFIPKYLNALNAEKLFSEYKRGDSWTVTMDKVVMTSQVTDGKTISDIVDASTKVPHFPEMLSVLRIVKEAGPLHVVSDANSVFIESFFKHHSISYDTVYTNPAKVDSNGVLRVHPYTEITGPHKCPTCPMNMCKGTILREQILASFKAQGVTENGNQALSRPRIVYFGDGSNDFCPAATVMSETDILFARDDPDDPNARGLVTKLQEKGHLVKAQVIRWKKGRDLLELVKRHVLK